ncbi:hypothetical protein CPU12_00880 [Malaciobacter molluscorum LMG 25693]|uniref:PIN like domain-containing protein n=1 Tax=Malaciobacter molluscorum LMG 25693 TaxID=870501 RepID=A0A2G1DLV2_9BACT|nr:PIN-like domain-containing protein [Malaciobacter molluscorum]PHO19364.1 hypothetical protein CPU12_00880 [Malaciobacter molluscorum LMG 25693]
MDINAIDIYKMTEERERKLWENAIFIFDSSALLDLYYLPKKTREKVYNEVFEKIPDRFWIPAHVQFEYLKNREKIIKKPIAEKFIPLEDEVKRTTVKVKDVLKLVNSIIDKTKKDDKHPYIEQTKISLFAEEVNKFIKKSENFEKDFLEQIDSAKNDVLSVENNDDILQAIEKYFKTGPEFTFDQILQITREGKHRYEYKIPPGYGDFYKKEKKGIQIFGDLIIWKQIIEYSKEKNLPIIFITNDISKDDDWCYLDNNKKIISPREELIKEIYDAANVEFWIYTQPDFLYKANKYLQSTIEEVSIQNALSMLTQRNMKQHFLRYRCLQCNRINTVYKNNLDLDFECVASDDRNMGSENQYEAREYFECDCGNEVEAIFTVWEYPIGMHNYDSIELYGGDLIDSFDFTVNFFSEEEREEVECDICGSEFEKDRMIFIEEIGYICPFHEINPENKHHND